MDVCVCECVCVYVYIYTHTHTKDLPRFYNFPGNILEIVTAKTKVHKIQ